MSCEVLSNCQNQPWKCDDCYKYNGYLPIDKKIKSPTQIARKEEKKTKHKELKCSDRSKMGKSNKNKGRTDENALVKKLAKYGIEAERMPLSGSLGGKYSNDIHLHLSPNLTLYIENKRRKTNYFKKYYEMARTNTEIESFCVVMNQGTFTGMCTNGIFAFCGEKEEDKYHKELHDFFSQDNSDIVTLHEAYKDWIFCVPREIIDKIMKEVNK